MKLRIKGNSLRLRLTRSEVRMLADESYVQEKTNFGSNSLIYTVQTSEEYPSISSTFRNNMIIVFVPLQVAKAWPNNDIVSLSGEMEVESDILSILIEKDFKCIDATTEDQSDNYENPNQVC